MIKKNETAGNVDVYPENTKREASRETNTGSMMIPLIFTK